MKALQINNFEPLSVAQAKSLEIVDVFSVSWKKIIELESHSLLTYLIVCVGDDIDIQITTAWPYCSCLVFGLFASDAKHPVTGSFKVILNHSNTSANVELISFLYDWAKVAIDGSIDIWMHLNQVHGRLLEQNIVLWKDISLKTLPRLHVASHDVHASHGANIDVLDQQKLFYMMSRGLSQQQSQKLLVDWYIEYVLGHFTQISDTDKQNVLNTLKH